MGGLKSWWRGVRPYVLSGLISFVVRGLGNTLRISTPGREAYEALPGGKLLAGWHGRSLIATKVLRGQGYWALISLSRDGEMQDRIFRSFGYQSIRGSTGRGGVKALIEAIDILKSGGKMALTPDGPRGPAEVVQPGILMMAKKSGAAIVPVGISARWRWLAPTWDRYMVPLPFSKAVMIFGDPIYVPLGATDEEVEQLRLQVETEIHRVQVEAESTMGRKE